MAAALTSALYGLALPGAMAVFGEIGLSGEIRPVSQMAVRLKEAGKLGVTQALTPRLRAKPGAISVRELEAVGDLFELFPSDRSPDARAVGM